MAINFPDSPSNGDIFGNFTYDTSIPGWRKTPENSASLPAGTIVQWPGAIAPANWLICDGSAVSRSTYASLFAAIGVQYGSGDGTTTFNLPNLKGRVAVGLDSSQIEFDTLGETGGAKAHTLTEAEIPSHTHIQNSHTHIQNSHNHTQDAHAHDVYVNSFAGDRRIAMGPLGGDGDKYSISDSGNDASTNTALLYAKSTTATNQATTATNQATTATNQNTGGGGAHNNLQPYITLNYIIKTSAGITSGDSELATRVGVVEAANNATPLSQNYLINGGFDIWQRGTAVTNCGEGVYFADRWAPNEYQTNRVSRSAVTAGQGPVSQYAIRSATRAAASRGVVYQKIESTNSVPLRGKTVTFSFWMRSSASSWVSSATDYVGFRYYLGFNTTTTDGAVGQAAGGFDSSVNALVANGSLPTSWTRYSISTTVPLTANNIAVRMGMHSDGTAANDAYWFEVTDVQLEEGSYATPFRRNQPNIQAELAVCQRYYHKNLQVLGPLNTTYGNSYAQMVYYPTTMRAAPSITYYPGANLSGTAGNVSWYNSTGAAGNSAGTLEYIDNQGFYMMKSGANNYTLAVFSYTASAEL